VSHFATNYESSFDERKDEILSQGAPAEQQINQDMLDLIDTEMYNIKSVGSKIFQKSCF